MLCYFLQITADHVILALGVKPNCDIAKSSDLEVDEKMGGFLVNSELAARTNLYVVCIKYFFSSYIQILIEV